MAIILGVTAGPDPVAWSGNFSLDVSSIAGSGRIGIICTSINGPGHDPYLSSYHQVTTSGWVAQNEFGLGAGPTNAGESYSPGVGIFYGPLDGVSSVSFTSSQAASHSSAVAFAVEESNFDPATLQVSSVTHNSASSQYFSKTFPDRTGRGGWVVVAGLNDINYWTECHVPTAEYGDAASDMYSAATAHAGEIPEGSSFVNQICDLYVPNGVSHSSVMTATWGVAGGSGCCAGCPDVSSCNAR